MRGRARPAPDPGQHPAGADGPTARQVIVPILKRLPGYLRLAWALGNEPAIPKHHKALLYSAALYPLSPPSLAIGAIPVVGQVDTLLLFLLGLRQAIRHCPPEIAARHFERARMREDQLDRDLHEVGALVRKTARAMGRSVGNQLRFAGRVAGGFARRTAKRLARS